MHVGECISPARKQRRRCIWKSILLFPLTFSTDAKTLHVTGRQTYRHAGYAYLPSMHDMDQLLFRTRLVFLSTWNIAVSMLLDIARRFDEMQLRGLCFISGG